LKERHIYVDIIEYYLATCQLISFDHRCKRTKNKTISKVTKTKGQYPCHFPFLCFDLIPNLFSRDKSI